MPEVRAGELCCLPVNIEVDPVVKLGVIAPWIGVDGDSNSGHGRVALPQVYHIVLLNFDSVIHKHMVSDSSTCARREAANVIAAITSKAVRTC